MADFKLLFVMICCLFNLNTILAKQDQQHTTYLSPNPATTNLDIGYIVAETDNAYIMLTNSTTGLSYNYVLNSANNNQLIPVDQLPEGIYIVNLVANGEIIDIKNLIIN